MWPEKRDDYFINPDDIAREGLHLVNQNRSAWTFDHWLRPFGERWLCCKKTTIKNNNLFNIC